MSTYSEQRRLAEIAAGRARLEERYGYRAEAEAPASEPKDPAEPVTLSIPGVGDYQAGQAVVPGFVVSDAPLAVADTEAALAKAQERAAEKPTVNEAGEAVVHIPGVSTTGLAKVTTVRIYTDAPLEPEQVVQMTAAQTIITTADTVTAENFDQTAGVIEAAASLMARPVIYTHEQLREIAAKEGLKGLRAIAEPLGVVGRGKDELIREIQIAQGTWVEPAPGAEVTEEVTEQPASPPLPPGMSADFDIDDLLK